MAKEVTKKASLAAMARSIAIPRLRSAQAPGRVLPIDRISRAYDLKVASIGRKEPPRLRSVQAQPEGRAEPELAMVWDRLV